MVGIKHIFCIACLGVSLLLSFTGKAQVVSSSYNAGNIDIGGATIVVDGNDHELVKRAAALLQKDLQAITNKPSPLLNQLPKADRVVIVGSADQSSIIKELLRSNKLKLDAISGKWEGYHIETINNPFPNIRQALVLTGNDRRGTAYGLFELTAQMGVSPWHWWADVPVVKKKSVFIDPGVKLADWPRVKYRGIFINDEAPALSGWAREKFGGFNHQFYEKVFELMLRLKANYLWPAMWGNAFYDDDPLNRKMADDYGIVIGTSHHEPLMRAHDEWRRYGRGGAWNYEKNKTALQDFWRGGMQRATNEKIVSVGMRGDGDEPMSEETATTLLENIVKDQRQIIADVTGKPAEQTPQLWALYKEVQDYYDKGMRVPDDVTLLLCDDNWGNIRRLPKLNEQPRKGGYGIYYHFDYVGGPRNYKWINTNPIPRIWEQMHLAWKYNARQIWIVNVGDIKPMEFPISFFLDYAWNPEKTGAEDLGTYTKKWAAAQFGNKHAEEIADIVSTTAKYNGRRKPELLDDRTYSFNFGEWHAVVKDFNTLLKSSDSINSLLPADYKDAYFQLVHHPVKAAANLHEMYYHVALNKEAYKNRSAVANSHADKVKALYLKDSLITLEYHAINNGKWNHMMSQTHIGYTYWQQPPFNKMPEVKYITADSVIAETTFSKAHTTSSKTKPAAVSGNSFYQLNNYISIGAEHFSRAVNSKGINWKILPDHGKTGSAVTTFPVTAGTIKPGAGSPHLQFDIFTQSEGEMIIRAYFSPTLNFHHETNGLQFAISVDDEAPQIISINKEDQNLKSWENWVANNIIIKSSHHQISKPGSHTIKYWMVNSGVVLQKLVAHFGELPNSYLGPPETRIKK